MAFLFICLHGILFVPLHGSTLSQNFYSKCQIECSRCLYSLLFYLQMLITKSLASFIAAASTSAMGGYDIDRRKGHNLSAKFSTMLTDVGNKLNDCTDVDTLKKF